MINVKRFHVVLTLIVMLTLLSPATPGNANGGPAIDRAGGPKNRIKVVLQADGAPLPGGVATLTFEATPLIAAPDLQIHWVVPADVELLGDETETLGSVAAHQTVNSQRQIRFPADGTYKIAVQATFNPARGVQLGASGVLFFTIDGRGSRASDKDPDARSPMHSTMPTQVTTSARPVTVPNAVSGDPCFTVRGRIMRTDRPPTSSGYGADVPVPVRFAVVDIREEDILFDDSYGEVLTDANGNYSKSFCDDDGWFDDTLEVYVRLVAEIYSGGTFVAEVIDSSWIDEVYEFDSSVMSSGGGTLTLNMNLDINQSAIFNIADAVYDAWSYWNDSGGEAGGDSVFDEEGEVHWEPGYGDTGSYYISFWGEITIADDPSNPDQWDDSVIIHEWGHMADDEYSCDDNPGGTHYVNQLVGDPELSWGEGYPDYWQSAVRAGKGYTDGNFYIDIGGTTSGNIIINLETWDMTNPTLVSTLSEFAIAAALWDLNDSANDRQDTVGHGHTMIQSVYTSDTFENIAYGFWDDTCEFDTYARAWVTTGNPADAATAAAIRQNTGYTLPPSTLMAQSPNTTEAVNTTYGPSDYIWWNQLTYVVDNSASMAGSKFEAVKTVLGEAINDLGSEPEGTEFTLYTFNNTSSSNQVIFAGQFFPNSITPAVNSLSTSGASDPNCQVDALKALAQAVDGQSGGDAWLFTDGDTTTIFPSVENVKQILNERMMHASIALLGLCPSAVDAPTTEQEARTQQLLQGAAKAYLGLAAGETPGGLVPYLLTAINSGGQFLYVDPSQVADAADILRAQITHSAGAGRWSDYVSDHATYRWDRLASWEYNWIDASPEAGGTNWGQIPGGEGYVDVTIPGSFQYYNAGPFEVAHVYENGYLTLGSYFGTQQVNTTLPNPAVPNNAIYPFWDDLDWTPDANLKLANDDYGYIYSKQEGNWFAIEYHNFLSVTVLPFSYNIFEVLLNLTTGEIRFLYNTLPDGAGSATIGVENSNGSDAVQVSYNDVNGAWGNMGYKFTPMPPQPTKTYVVTVDGLMSGVGFLLTGYSGSFDPLAVYYPDGTPVDCTDTENVLCLDLGLVQYVQADVEGQAGEWQAVVDAGPTGSGTFSFISMAASALSAESPGDHSLSTTGDVGLLVDLGQAVDRNVLTGWFQQPDDKPFGRTFNLYDDGEHGDGFAGDGLFGSDPYTPPRASTGYLWVEGELRGVSFIRSDPVPFTFQPVSITSLGDGANTGGATELQFELKNHDVQDHCYRYESQVPDGWWLELGWIPLVCLNAGQTFIPRPGPAPSAPPAPLVCLNAGQTFIQTVQAYMGPGYTNNLPSGTSGEVTLSIVEWEEGVMSDTASARVMRHRPPAAIGIHNPTSYLRPNGDTTTLDFMVVDEQNVIVADGTEVQLSATMGNITPATGTTEGGYFSATFTSGATEGTAVVTALTGNGVSETTEIVIGTPKPSQIQLEVSPDNLPADGASTASLVATVNDRWGTLVTDQVVRIGVEGDGQMGTISGGEVISGTTDANGQLSATFTSGTISGEAGVRAELLVLEGSDYRVVHEDRQVIAVGSKKVYLPVILQGFQK